MSATSGPSQEIIDQFVGNAHGNLAMVKELYEKYPSMINASASWTESAIQAAAQTGQVEIVNFLLEHGAEYDICSAAMLGALDCIEDFLKEDPNRVSARGAHGIPLLYFPVIHGHTRVAQYLLEQGADPNAASPDGITPLHGAVMFNRPKMASWLLDHGANPNPIYDSKTPLAMAQEKKQAEMVEILRNYGGK
ncbi:MAG TPA: ankyrin repeat domain-containing protein [Anaerolineales bacterium]